MFICISCFTFGFIGPEKTIWESFQLRNLYNYYQDLRNETEEVRKKEISGHRDSHHSESVRGEFCFSDPDASWNAEVNTRKLKRPHGRRMVIIEKL